MIAPISQRFRRVDDILHVVTNLATNPLHAAGDFVVTWTSTWTQDGSGPGIFAQRYNMILR